MSRTPKSRNVDKDNLVRRRKRTIADAIFTFVEDKSKAEQDRLSNLPQGS